MTDPIAGLVVYGHTTRICQLGRAFDMHFKRSLSSRPRVRQAHPSSSALNTGVEGARKEAMLNPDARLKTNYSLFVAEADEGLVLSANGNDPITLTGNTRLVTTCLLECDGRATAPEIETRLGELGFAQHDVREVLEFLLDENFLKYELGLPARGAFDLDDRALLKWDRQIKDFATLPGVDDARAIEFQARLRDAHLVILGVGGVGSYMAAAAAMIGIGKLTLIDFDSIELSNTSRQVLYLESDVGRSKLEVAVERIPTHDSTIAVAAIDREIRSVSDMDVVIEGSVAKNGPIDFLVLSADTPRGEIQYIVDEACGQHNVPYMNLGPYGFHHAAMGPMVIPGQTRSYAEYFPRDTIFSPSSVVDQINERFVASIMDPHNGLIAKMGMVEIVKYLTGYARPAVLDCMIDLNASDWSVRHRAC